MLRLDMITKLSHAPIFVLDQDSALDFYVNKLGFEVATDAMMGSFRWLTVRPKTQPDLELILFSIQPSEQRTEEQSNLFKQLLKEGQLAAMAFEVDDCRATYEDLKAKGVQFRSEPEEQFYGIECTMMDDSGNWFSVTQPKPH
jgi:catechol 2,3-dioxygenase-like lactoylglutathione lyase family enzyme